MRALAIDTFTGKAFPLLGPAADDITIVDIAHALSLQCRFVGQIGAFYSVAQHSVLCSHYCDPGDALVALLHDAAEAYIGDLARPVKGAPGMEWYRAVDVHLTTLILQRFGLSGRIPERVWRADDLLCRQEARELFVVPPDWARVEDEECPMTRRRINPWPPGHAEQQFLHRFTELAGGLSS